MEIRGYLRGGAELCRIWDRIIIGGACARAPLLYRPYPIQNSSSFVLYLYNDPFFSGVLISPNP